MFSINFNLHSSIMEVIKKIGKKIKKWHAYWVWIEEQRMKAAIYSCSAGPLM